MNYCTKIKQLVFAEICDALVVKNFKIYKTICSFRIIWFIYEKISRTESRIHYTILFFEYKYKKANNCYSDFIKAFDPVNKIK